MISPQRKAYGHYRDLEAIATLEVITDIDHAKVAAMMLFYIETATMLS